MTTRIYHGRINKIEWVTTSAFGFKTYKIHFANGFAYFQLSAGRTLNFKAGDTINFSGNWMGNEKERVFSIIKIYSLDELAYIMEYENKMQQMIME